MTKFILKFIIFFSSFLQDINFLIFIGLEFCASISTFTGYYWEFVSTEQVL